MRFEQILERHSLGLQTLYSGFINEVDGFFCYPPGSMMVKIKDNSHFLDTN